MDRKKSTGKKYEKKYRDLSGGLVVSTQHCHCQGLGSIPGWGTKILQASQCGQEKKQMAKKKKRKEAQAH